MPSSGGIFIVFSPSGCGRGEHNLGQLVRERYGEEACLLVGLSSYQGTVMAGSKWGAPMQVYGR